LIDRINAQVDIVMPTYNNNGPWFKRCLLSIKREVPVHCARAQIPFLDEEITRTQTIKKTAKSYFIKPVLTRYLGFKYW
jgi:hypothetical protein